MRVLTTLFFLMAFVVPVQAAHSVSAPYVCTSMADAMTTVGYVVNEQTEELYDRAKNDPTFNCYLIPLGTQFKPLELMHEYNDHGQHKGVLRAVAPDGVEVFLFGPINLINSMLHEKSL